MEYISKRQIVIFNTLLNAIGKQRGVAVDKDEKEDIIYKFSEGRTNSTTKLYKHQATEMIKTLKGNEDTGDESAERMRRHIIAMAHEMHWELPSGKIDMKRVNGWVANYGYLNKTHHSLNQYRQNELPQLVSQFKNVYQSFLKGI